MVAFSKTELYFTKPDGEKKLRKIFKKKTFRPGQWRVVKALKRKVNVLIIWPTGSGKSLPVQFITMAVKRGYTLVLSPTEALMMEQARYLSSLGAMVACPNSDNYSNKSKGSQAKYWQSVADRILANKLNFLILSPERLVKNLGLAKFRAQILHKDYLNWVFIDEIHLVTSWGQEFQA